MSVRHILLAMAVIGIGLAAFIAFEYLTLAPLKVSLSRSAKTLGTYDMFELAAHVSAPHAANPFTDATIQATFASAAGDKKWQIEGFATRRTGAYTGYGSCHPRQATTRTPLSTGKGGRTQPPREAFV